MSNNPQKTATPPKDTDASNPIKVCKQDIGVYPARLALKTTTLDKFSTTTALPNLPKHYDKLGQDYELRRLRDGFIYILSDNADDSGITARASDSKSWYVYRYYSPDVKTRNNKGNSAK